MSNNLLDQLSQDEVPPPPEQLREDLHGHLNQWLLAAHALDFLLHGFAYAAGQFCAAVLGMLKFTLTGEYQRQRE